MTKKNRDLRRRAEEYLRKKENGNGADIDLDKEKIVEELQVHQAELEIQNEDLQRTLNELEEERNKYTDLYDFAPIGYFTINTDGFIEEVNLTGARMLGKERSKLLQDRFSAFIHPDDEDIYYPYKDELLKTKLVNTTELRLLKKKQTEFYARLVSVPIMNGDNEVKSIKVTVSDISKFREAQQHWIYKNFLESVFKGTAMPMFIIDIDEKSEYRITGLNPAYERITGIKDEDAKDKTPEEIPGISAQAAHQIRSHYDDCVKERKSIQYRENVMVFNKNLYWLTTLTPLFGENRRIYRLIGSSMNITELIDTYKELEAKNDEYERRSQLQKLKLEELDKHHNEILRAVGHGEWKWEIESDTIFFSPGWKNVLGYKNDDLKNKLVTLQNLIHPNDHDWVIDALSDYISDPVEDLKLTFRMKHKDTDYRWIQLTGAAIKDPDRNLKSIVGTITDISEQIETELELKRCKEDLDKRK